VLALGLHYSAYTAEVYRAGIQAVPDGQREAALALGFTRRHLLQRIILPQAIPPILPALGNCLIAMFKDTPLLSTITVLELLNTAKEIGAGTFRYLEPFTIVGVLFLVVSLVAAGGVRLVERRMRRSYA
jgi:polar amino acid transport system permease protein